MQYILKRAHSGDAWQRPVFFGEGEIVEFWIEIPYESEQKMKEDIKTLLDFTFGSESNLNIFGRITSFPVFIFVLIPSLLAFGFVAMLWALLDKLFLKKRKEQK